jgi:hypothetical protein
MMTMQSHTTAMVRAEADPIDLYGEVLGERGNVPAGVRWDFPGLSEKERSLVYARNDKSATGGKTSYITMLTKEDIYGKDQRSGAKQRLEQELLLVAKQQVEDDRLTANNVQETDFVELRRSDLTTIKYSNFQLSDSFIGQQVNSVPVSGSIDYTVVVYDESALLELLREEARKRVSAEKSIVEASLSKENMEIFVIPPWDDDLRWVKITANLTYNQTYILNPLTPTGAKLAKSIRDSVAGKTVTEAHRIISNMPEVSTAEIRVWPPWTYILPAIGPSILITEVEGANRL